MLSFGAVMVSYLAFLLYLPFTSAFSIPGLEKRQGNSYCPVSTYPNGQTTTVCYDTTYYRAADQGQRTNSQADVNQYMMQCQQSCSADSQCTAFVLAQQLAADSNLATATCFFYNHTPSPRSCSDGSSRRLFAQTKAASGSCPATTTTTTTTTRTTAPTTTTTTRTTTPTTTTTTTTTSRSTTTTTTTTPTTTTTSRSTTTTTTTTPTTTTTTTTSRSTTTTTTTPTTTTTTTTTSTSSSSSTSTSSTSTTGSSSTTSSSSSTSSSSTTTTTTTSASTTTTTTTTPTTTTITTTTTTTTTTPTTTTTTTPTTTMGTTGFTVSVTTTTTTTTTTATPAPSCTPGNLCLSGNSFSVNCGIGASGSLGANSVNTASGITSYQACAAICSNDIQCNIYSYNVQTQTCTTFDGAMANPSTSDANSVSGAYLGAC